MPKYMITREFPGAANLTPSEMRDACSKSNGVLRDLTRCGRNVQWIHSDVSQDRFVCVYNAESEDVIREHARASGFPADRIDLVSEIVDPTTGE
jgi:hypothetical protein